MSRLKIEKSVVLFVAPLTKALKEIQFDYGFESRTTENRSDLSLF
jgi:hypothetical protein